MSILSPKNSIRFFLFFTGLFFASSLSLSAQDRLMDILKTELYREAKEFRAMNDSADCPYFISFRVDATKSETVNASSGSLLYSRASYHRIFTPMVRIGSYQLDNYHQIRESAVFNRTEPSYLPVEDAEDAIRQTVWWMTDQACKNAVERYEKARSNIAVKVKEEDGSGDYTPQKAVKYFEPETDSRQLRFKRSDWEKKLCRYSAAFARPDIMDGWANISLQTVRKYYVSTEGSEIAHNQTYIHLAIGARVKADDGMDLPLHYSWFAQTVGHLPSDREVLAKVEQLAEKLKMMKQAPVVDAFSGPALLSAEAAGVFFHEIFGHRVEGQRMRLESDGQTFKNKIGEAVLPSFLTVYMDPTITSYKGTDVNGFCRYDDEGVKSEKVMLVENGILQTFLMSRVPLEGFPASNGHGRAAPGMNPVTRQSNLIVETSHPKTEKELRQALKAELQQQGKTFGYYFASVTGGFTQTGRYMPNAFNVTPTEVYRVYADDRPDEMVRGVDLVGTPLAMFSQIALAGDRHGFFNGACGAESGSIPVACISPMLFVKQIEIQKQSKSQSKPPLLPKP
ncbi:MAG: TldD/PmbA family protein [Bacteroidales bacterium]|jgi:predicted Zn-dependent protease|nr:TldD/PmbA family protein [Bacteroidales bacterium]